MKPTRRRIPTVKVAVAITVPTIHRMSLVSRFPISVRSSAIPVRCSVRSSAICVERRVSRAAISLPQLGESGLELVGRDVIALFDRLTDGAGDHFGLRPRHAAVGELSGNSKRIEHTGSVAQTSVTREPPQAQVGQTRRRHSPRVEVRIPMPPLLVEPRQRSCARAPLRTSGRV